MHALLHHPAVVAGLIPFLAALLTAEALLRLRLSGLALLAGFAASVYLLADFQFEPLTFTHLLIWLGVGSTVLGLLLGMLQARWLRSVVVLLGASSSYLLWPMLSAHSLWPTLAWTAGCVVFMAILAGAMDALQHEAMRAANATTAMASGIGVALLHDPLHSQFAFAIAAAAGAHLCVQLLGKQTLPTGRSFTLPAALLPGMLACIAVLSGQLAWVSLPLLAALPIVAWLLPLPKLPVFAQTLLLGVVTFGLATAAVYLGSRAFL